MIKKVMCNKNWHIFSVPHTGDDEVDPVWEEGWAAHRGWRLGQECNTHRQGPPEPGKRKQENRGKLSVILNLLQQLCSMKI